MNPREARRRRRGHGLLAALVLPALWGLTSWFDVTEALGQAARRNPRVYRDVVTAHWFDGDDRFWYRNDLPDGKLEFILVDAVRGSRQRAFDHEQVAARLAELLDRSVDADRLPIEALQFDPDGQTVHLLGTEVSWRLDLTSDTLTRATGGVSVDGLLFDHTVRPSARTGPETHVTFLNRLDLTIKLFWIDGSGGRHEYAVLGPGERRRQHTFAGHIWLATDEAGRVLAVFEAPDREVLAVVDEREPGEVVPTAVEPAAPPGAVSSPNGRLAVFVRDHNLWLRDRAAGTESPLSFDGRAGDTYRKDTQRARLVEMEYDAAAVADSVPDAVWSPDSRYVVARRTRAVAERRVYLVDSAPDDRVQPRLQSYPYLKPGDDVPVGRPQLFDVVRQERISLDERLFAEPWDIAEIHWAPDASRCFFLYNERGHQVMRVIAVETGSGEVSALVEERSPTFLDYQGKTHLQHLDETDELIWMSERDGWNHLYLYDRVVGEVKNRITRGKWVVRGVDRVDQEQRRLWFRASGLVKGQDPYLVHHCRVDSDGKNLVVLTEGDGTHRIDWSPDRRYLIDTWSRVDLPPRHALRQAEDGRQICLLETADAHEVEVIGRRFPTPFVATGRDGRTDIHGIIHWPTHFDPAGSYPVIENIYAGPHGQHVPKDFRVHYRLQSLADRGFVIVQIDGMGTNWRGKDFHDVCWRNLVDAGLPDRVRWIEAAARAHSALDISRVGIYGGSAGGQNALTALLTHGDFYRVAVADCGCHDNRMDKIWWNEQWMGYPVGHHYVEQSNVTLAPRLEGELLLIVGELDRNVDPASTMQVVDALIAADKDFEMLVIPGVGHGAAGTAYGRRRLQEFFVSNLLE